MTGAGDGVTEHGGSRCPEHDVPFQETYPDGEGGMLYRCQPGNHWWRVPKDHPDV